MNKKIATTLALAMALLMPVNALAWCAAYDRASCEAEAETRLRDSLGEMYYWCYNYGPGLEMWDRATCDEAYRVYNNSMIDCEVCYPAYEPCAWWDWFCEWENYWGW